ncbi:pilus assembly FimT family protein [Rivibacter subsaxonicus]|uniref:General secretion pathway protein H n=1 Tax=Rivibacter subsaxonicus TaxID=457575 RepID=A0A4Q7VZ01_9BURK|nr:prepilin-type N-terminal cleavage/methylation domain-containing protein [Rivibacter subsaxonicus]RZU02052.1 general secretion pathway protein H [Rivibacter subsaxonicus]
MSRRRKPQADSRGFTLIELMVVVALIAIASTIAVLALRDPAAARLDREASRLAALLESARAESRALGVPVHWVPMVDAGSGAALGFRFVGLPDPEKRPAGWLEAEPLAVQAYADTPAGYASTRALVLGPEPVIGAQRIVLRLGDRQLVLSTDGLGPFSISADAAGSP